MSRYLFHILALLILTLGICIPTKGVFANDFPRLANYFLKYDISEQEARELAQWDLIILDMEVQVKSPQALRIIREHNPESIILAYVTAQEIFTDAPTGYSVLRQTLARGVQDAWYLRDTRGQRISWWPGTYMLDMTNTSGWPTYLREFMIREVLATGLWDGIFYDNTWDNVTYFVGTEVQVVHGGRQLSRTELDTAWRHGMTFLYETTRERTSAQYPVVGNGTTQVYSGSLNGQMIENFLGGAAWAPTMQAYQQFETTHSMPRLNIINANTGNRGDMRAYRHMRFGLTSALLLNGYYSYDFGDTAHNQTWWYDEYDINLGAALGTANSLTGATNFAPGIWRRDFDRGISLVNSDATPRTVALDGEFEALTGRQDPIANNGAIVSSLTVPAQDGRILLKTTDTLDNVLFTNGDFARFFRADGSRVRNGFFVFDEAHRGGTQIARMDMDGNGQPEILLVTGPRVELYRDTGELYLRVHPYTANYQGEIRIAVGDLNGDGVATLFVAPGPGSALPIKVYTLYGTQVRADWYPFGDQYRGGYSLAIGRFSSPLRPYLVIGGGTGSQPYVNVYNAQYQKERDWFAYERGFTGGVFVATGDINGDGIDEIITGPGAGKGPVIRTFRADGTLLNEFTAYSTPLQEGIRVRTLDVDFDGIADIVGFSSGL